MSGRLTTTPQDPVGVKRSTRSGTGHWRTSFMLWTRTALSSASPQSSARWRYQYIAYTSSINDTIALVRGERLLREALPRRM